MFEEKEIYEFQEIFKREFGYQISYSDAVEYAKSLIELLTATYHE